MKLNSLFENANGVICYLEWHATGGGGGPGSKSAPHPIHPPSPLQARYKYFSDVMEALTNQADGIGAVRIIWMEDGLQRSAVFIKGKITDQCEGFVKEFIKRDTTT